MFSNNYIASDPVARFSRSRLKGRSAYHKIRLHYRLIIALIAIGVIAAALVWPLSFGIFLFTLGFLNYLFLLVFRMSNVLGTSPKKSDFLIPNIPPEKLPTISIILPLKNEGIVIWPTIKAIESLDYPESLKELIIVVEQTDLLTRKTLNEMELPTFSQIKVIPEDPPFTKARALMHALPLVTGQFLTVYDAESRPEQDQLKKAISVMAAHPGKNLCLQSKIRISNLEEGWMSRNFASEYYEWYELHLKELSDGGYPFGLGGNSFFIATDVLRGAGGWDPYNVTEDAELSIRLVQKEVKFKILDSYTEEASPLSLKDWINQRTRWNKGLFVTQLVHMVRTLGAKQFGKSAWVNFWLPMCCNTMLPFFNFFIPLYIIFSGIPWALFVAISILLWGILIINLVSSAVLNRIVYKRLGIKVGYFRIFLDVIAYLFLHLAAGFKAYAEYFYAPLHWHKTHHEERKSKDAPVLPIQDKKPMFNLKP